MSSAEYSMRLYHRDPWGDRTVAVLLAQLLAMTFNVHRGKDSRSMTVDDFLPIAKAVPIVSASTIDDVRAFMEDWK